MISMVEIVKAPVYSKNILILSVILKSIIIFFLLIGFTITIIDAIKDQSALIFTFFTIISNFFILISTIIFLFPISDAISIKTGMAAVSFLICDFLA